ncbi:MAG: hypothetical protein ACRD0G_14820 [Acidimicrobiales bacterium]
MALAWLAGYAADLFDRAVAPYVTDDDESAPDLFDRAVADTSARRDERGQA